MSFLHRIRGDVQRKSRYSSTLHLWALILCAVNLWSSRFNGCLNSRMSCFTGGLRTYTTKVGTDRQVQSPRRASAKESEFGQLSDCAFLITTSCSTLRRRNALAALSEVCEPQVRIFERDENGARGCYFSHLSIYKEALEKNLPWALILEDNLIMAQNPASSTGVGESIIGTVDRMSQSKNKEISDWSVLHLSLVHSAASLRLKLVEDGTRTILKVERTAPDWYGPVNIMRAPGLGTTAYIITRKGMQEMLQLDQGFESFERPIDDLLAERFAESTFAMFPAPLHRGQTASLINPDQQLFRSIMYDERVFRNIESALVSTGLSSSQLVWLFLFSMAAWTFGVTLPVLSFLLK